MSLDRRDYKTSIPQLEARLKELEKVGEKGLSNFNILQYLIEKEIQERQRLYLKQETSLDTMVVKMYYALVDEDEPTPPLATEWSETMPNIDSGAEGMVLWYKTKTLRNGVVTNETAPQKVQLMDGVFSFINSVASDSGWTTINGDVISTGRIQDNQTGDNYFDLDTGEFNFQDTNGNYVRQTGNGVEIAGTLSLTGTNVGTRTLEDILNEVDGNITTYSGAYVPTLSNLPASGWSSAEMKTHVGDLFYDSTTQKAYRFMTDGALNPTYSWDLVEDTDISLALTRASNATERSQRIYYRKSSSGAPTAPSGQNSWVDRGNDGSNYYDQWTTKVPPLSEDDGVTKYPYLYSCIQSQKTDGSNPTCSTVLLDENTTVIDGGSIITNSITANQIQTNTITIGQSQVTNLTTDLSNKAEKSDAIASVTTKDQYYLSTSDSSATGGSWQDTVPTWSSGKYIWTRVSTTKTTVSGTSTTTPSTAVYDSALTSALADITTKANSTDAVSSVVTTQQYYLSTSDSSATGGSWGDSVPTWTSGKYIWTRFKIVKTPVSGSASTSYTPSSSGVYDATITAQIADAQQIKMSSASGSIATFNDASEYPALDVVADIDPIQGLNGYDAPWVGGAGKNLIPMVLADLKSNNTNGTWSGNVYTYNNLTFTVNVDSANNVTSIKVNGTNNNNKTRFTLGYPTLTSGTTYTLSGAPSGYSGTDATIYLGDSPATIGISNPAMSGGNPVTFTPTQTGAPTANININENVAVSNALFYPQVETGTATTFEPYTNICPISGHNDVEVSVVGKNLFDGSNATAGKYFNSTGTIMTDAGWNISDYIPVPSSETLYFNPNTTEGASAKHIYYDANKTFISSIASGALQFTTPSNAKYMRFSYRSTSTDIQLEIGSSATTYEPYNGDTYTTALGTTVYGGTLDVVSGELTVDKVITTDFSNWIKHSSYSHLFNSPTSLSNIKNLGDISCNCLVKNNSALATFSTINGVVKQSDRIYVNIENCSTLAEFKAWASSVSLQICYELATPKTYQLTPQQIMLLQGTTNNVWTDTGDVSIQYAIIADSAVDALRDPISNASKTATSYITAIDEGGIKVHDAGDTTNYAKLDANGMDIVNGGDSVAFYGETARVGKTNEYNTFIDAGAFAINDDAGNTAFVVAPSSSSDTRTVYKRVNLAGNHKQYTSAIPISQTTITFIVKNGSAGTEYTADKASADLAVGASFTLGTYFTFTRVGTDSIKVVYSGSSTGYVTFKYTLTGQFCKINFYGENNVLWSGALFMSDTQSITLPETLSSQLNGIVLVWSAYANGGAVDYDWHYTFIPKQHAVTSSTNGISTGLMTSLVGSTNFIGTKYIYVSDTDISGHSGNNKSSQSFCGLTLNNSHWVLRYVLGV